MKCDEYFQGEPLVSLKLNPYLVTCHVLSKAILQFGVARVPTTAKLGDTLGSLSTTIWRNMDTSKLMGLLIALSVTAACNNTQKIPQQPRPVASLKVTDITRIDFNHHLTTIFSLENPKDKVDIERILLALQTGQLAKQVGKGGGRPDNIEITTKDPNVARPVIRIPTDFKRQREILGPEVAGVLDPMLIKPLANYDPMK